MFRQPRWRRKRDSRERWEKSAKDAGCEGLLFHDLRRSALRNMVRRGVSENIAMTISGHITRAVFDRYDITRERDLQEASENIAAGKAEYSDFGANH